MMKKLLTLFVCLFALQAVVRADDKPITVNQLPATARQFLKSHFSGIKIVHAQVDAGWINKSYDVMFDNGGSVEFDKDGQWKEVSCKTSEVPAAIVPGPIRNYVKKNHPTLKIVGIDRDTKDYELKLSNGVELKFDMKYNLIDYDN